VTAPVFVLPPAALPAPDVDRLVLDGIEGHHAADVRRLRAGERVDVTDGHGTRLTCRVAHAERGRLVLDVDDRVSEAPPRMRLVVAQALVKADAAEQAVTTLTEVGADEVLAWSAARSVVAWQGERVPRGLRRWEATATQAAKQSRRAWVPLVAGPLDLGALVARVRSATLAVLLDADESVPLGDLEVPHTGEVLLVVGPEGGVTPAERDALVGAGAVVASVGPTVLRAATAGTVAAAVVLSRSPRWRVPAGSGSAG
jgi:16S rRNA (uracil1498-N3)-methyltransferase